jgi:hypothetical protein
LIIGFASAVVNHRHQQHQQRLLLRRAIAMKQDAANRAAGDERRGNFGF